jgi:hypothetical protein
VKIHLHGTEDECVTAARRLGQVLGVVSVSRAYPDRGASRLVRVYVEARLDLLPDPVAGECGVQVDPGCCEGRHSAGGRGGTG